MSIIQPSVRALHRAPTLEESGWRGPATLALVVTALGALGGSTFSALLESTGAEWVRALPIITPLTALLAATSVYGRYRHRPLDRLQARIARALVLTGGSLMVMAVTLTQPRLAAVALWFMTGVTLVVTSLAAAGPSTGSDPSLPWAVEA